VAGFLVVLAQGGSSRPAEPPAGPTPEPSGSVSGPPAGASASLDPSFTLMQMNLCLSGLAGCYTRAAYPAVVEEAMARMRAARPDAVTFNEACRRDVARIARRTEYHVRFARVLYRGERLRCVRPGGRGLFGVAVLTRSPIRSVRSGPFRAQSGLEERRWLCVVTRADLAACTAHLHVRRTPTSAGTNRAQCDELTGRLARLAAGHRVVAFGGDMNRRRPCAPRGVWARTDRAADRAPGLQHVYGTRATLRSPSLELVPSRHSDHAVVLVHARRVRQPPPPGPSVTGSSR
jgi:endonuclease/exonuclease/phosphatase family metal-dependent hydrolase